MENKVTEQRTWDFRDKFLRWGHNIGYECLQDGIVLKAFGWGPKIEEMIGDVQSDYVKYKMVKDDYILLTGSAGETRYQIKEIRYCKDPSDMFFATLEFAPRK